MMIVAQRCRRIQESSHNMCSVHVCLKVSGVKPPPPPSFRRMPVLQSIMVAQISLLHGALAAFTHLTEEGARNPSAARDSTAQAPNLYSGGTSSCWWLYLGGPGAASSVQCFQSRLEITAARRCPSSPQGYVLLVILSMWHWTETPKTTRGTWTHCCKIGLAGNLILLMVACRIKSCSSMIPIIVPMTLCCVARAQHLISP